jgi:hypothetical protein
MTGKGTVHYAMETYGVDVRIHVFLISALVGSEWSSSLPGHFTPKEKAPCTHWIEGASLGFLKGELKKYAIKV